MAGEPLPPVVQEFIANVEPWVTALESAAESSQVMVEASAKVSASAEEMSAALKTAATEVSSAYAQIDEAANAGSTELDAADAKVTAGAEEMAASTKAAAAEVGAAYGQLGTAGNAGAAGLEAADTKVAAGAEQMATATGAAVTKVEDSYAKLGTAANTGAAELEAADAKVAAGAGQMATAVEAADAKAGESATALEAEMKALFAETDAAMAKSAGVITDGMAAESKAMRLTAAAAKESAAEVESGAAKSNAAMGGTAAKSKEAGTAAEGMGSKVKIAALGLGLGSVASIKMAGDFQQMTGRLVTGAGEVQSNLKMVQDGILQMSSSTNTSVKQLSDGMFMIESAGFHGKAGLDVLKAAAEGAKAENANLGDVSRALTSVMNDYGKQLGNPTQAMNALIAVESHGQVTMQELASSIHTVAPIAASVHLSFGQLGGAIATMTGQGMSAKQATLDLAHVIVSLKNPTAVQSKEMQALGLNSEDVSQKLGKRGLTGTFDLLSQTVLKSMGPSGEVLLKTFNSSKVASEDLKKEMEAMPPSVKSLAEQLMKGSISAKEYNKAALELPPIQQGQAAQFEASAKSAGGFNASLKAGVPGTQTYEGAIAKMTGGQMGLKAALMLTGDHQKAFTNNTNAVSAAAKKGGADVDHWKEIQDQFNNKLGGAEKAAKAVAIQWGTALLPAATKLMGVITTLGEWFTKNKVAAEALAGIVGAGLSIAVGGKMVKSVSDGVSAFKDLAGNIGKIGPLIGKLGPLFKGLFGVMGDVLGAVGKLSIALLASPWFWSSPRFFSWLPRFIFCGTKCAWFRDLWKGLWNLVKTAVSDAVDWVKTHWELLVEIITGPLGIIVGLVISNWDTIKNTFIEAMSIIENVLQTAWNAITDAVKTAWNGIVNFFTDIPGKIVKGFSRRIG